MSQGYYPSTNAGAIVWLTNYKTQIAVQGSIVGLTVFLSKNKPSLIKMIAEINNTFFRVGKSCRRFQKTTIKNTI